MSTQMESPEEILIMKRNNIILRKLQMCLSEWLELFPALLCRLSEIILLSDYTHTHTYIHYVLPCSADTC